MKPVHLVPPVLALAIAALWLGSQQRSISALEEKSGHLRKRIETARHEAAGDGSHIGRKDAGAKTGKGIDWKQIAQKHNSMQSGNDVQGMRAMMEMQRALLAMTTDELLGQLDEIEALDVPKELKSNLQGLLLGVLAQKDPRLAVERFADQIGKAQGSMSWQLGSAFQQWALKDPAAATAWMDARIAEGKFASTSLDGKNDQRLQFERGLIGTLLSTDPDAAAKRIAALPPEQGAEILRYGMIFGMKPGSEKALANLIRQQMPEDQRNKVLAEAVGQLVHQGGFERVDKFFGEIAPSQEERDAVVADAFQNKIRNIRDKAKLAATLEESRAWAMKHSPEQADRITGQALGSMHEFEAASELALKYHEQAGNDEVLVAFLSGEITRFHTEAATAMLDKISDEQKREELRKKLAEKR
jgi:hypothetical protein